MAKAKSRKQYVVCVRNDGYAASLEARKIYQSLPDKAAQARGYVRVVDESGEDYLYPADRFVPIEIPQAAQAAFASVA
jgi:hypothetical protein